MTQKKKKNTARIVLTCIMFLLSSVFLLPLLWMISSSLKTPGQVFESPFRWVTDQVRFGNYVSVWANEDMPFWAMFLNSLKISLLSVSGQLLIASMAAYAFSKIVFPGRDLIFMMMLMTMMIPVQALIIPRFMIFDTLKIYDTHWCIILPNLYSTTTIFLLRQFYKSLPDEIMEAAIIDGAGHPVIWWQIMLPLTRNGLISGAILAFISTWNEYLNPLVFLPSLQNYTVPLGIRWYLTDTATEYNLMMCAASSAIIPIVILYVSAQNYFEDGVATASVKG